MTAQALPTISQRFGAPTARIRRRLSTRTWEVNVVDQTSDPDWDSLVDSHPDSSFFHGAAWAKVLCKTYGHKPISLLLSRNGEPMALVPLLEVSSPFTGRRGVCLPFTDFCDPLFFGGFDFNIVSRPLCELARNREWKYFEIRGGSTSAQRTISSVRFYGHGLDLRSGPEALFAGFASSVRRAVRKARRWDLDVRISQSQEAILDFYRIHARTRRRHGLPPQPISFFLNIYDLVIKPGSGLVVLASRGKRPVAGAIFFHKRNKAVYKFAASDERLQHLRPSNLVLWEGINFLARQGFEKLHFGRTSLENQGLRRFKLSWGTAEETINYFRFDSTSNECIVVAGHVSGFHNTVIARLPLALNRLMGKLIYRHLD
jgi:CelD/BcsL family acetyltransferase involved in cellulose biosynthesis